MAENKKPRTNWSDKARRITGVIAVAVVILVIVLSVSLGKGKSAPSQTVKVEPTPTVVTESKPVVQESTEEVKTEEVEVKPEKVEIEAEPIIEIVEAEEVEAAAPEIEEAVEEAEVEETVESVPVVEEIVEEPPVVEEVAPVEAETASFTLFGYTVENSWLDGLFTSTLKEKGIVTEDDVRGFALSEVEKYGEMLTANTAISFVADGFTLTYPETVDPADYIDVYKADLVAYITSLFASEEAPEVEEAPVEEVVEETEEEMDIKTSDFDVFGYRILNSWYEGVFVSQTEEFGLVSEDDVIGFAEYEAEKYGELLTSNCYVYIVPDGFVLLYPETLDIAPYIGIYKSDLEEYITFLFAAAEEPAVEETIEEPPVVEEPKTKETVAVAPEAEVTEKEEVRVPEPVGEILVSVVTDKARVETENAPEAVKKLSTFSVSTSLGAEFGFKTGREYVTVFPRLDIAGEFRNVFSFGPVEIGARFDIASVFRPLDGTFLGHDFSYFLVGDNWAMDGTVDVKLMFSISSSSLRGYAGIGIGYSIASNVSGITSHTEPKVFGFNSAVVATGVLGLEWRISDAFSLSLEGQARYFMETKEYAVGAALRMGWNF
ncbi:MAG: hypothetical protein SPF69_00950 [Candidatus Ornithospirochaeta sp.]|nr:hypothetical protein [Sphaerochaetaceae bacterium]MDY5522635.1 hypothetical protein [Candidatus Ornithospirochaeta sp.]